MSFFSCCVVIVFALCLHTHSIACNGHTQTHIQNQTQTHTHTHTCGHFPAVLPFSSLMCVWGPDGVAAGGLIHSASRSASSLSFGLPWLVVEGEPAASYPSEWQWQVYNSRLCAQHLALLWLQDKLVYFFLWEPSCVVVWHFFVNYNSVIMTLVMFLCLLALFFLPFWCSYHMFSCLCPQRQEISWTRTWSIIWASASRNPRPTTNCSRPSETTSTATPCLVSPRPSYTCHCLFLMFVILCSAVFVHLFRPFSAMICWLYTQSSHTLFAWVPTEHRCGSKVIYFVSIHMKSKNPLG